MKRDPQLVSSEITKCDYSKPIFNTERTGVYETICTESFGREWPECVGGGAEQTARR